MASTFADTSGNTSYAIVLNNKDIWQFYHDHPHIDPEEANLLFIDFIDTMFQKQDQSQSQLAAYVRDSKSQLDALGHSVAALGENVAKLQTDVMMQLLAVKRDYVEDVRQIVGNQSLTVSEKMAAVVEKNNALLVDKTSLLLNESLPKSFRDFQQGLATETAALAQSMTKSMTPEGKVHDFLASFETRYQAMVVQPLFALCTGSEDRLSKHLEGLRDTTMAQQTQQNRMLDELSDFLGKYKHNSSHKGKFGELQLGQLLNALYPSAEVQVTGTSKATGDFVLRRAGDKVPILMENKDYDDNVPKEEVAKFLRDVDAQGMSGIFLSQRSGIVHKQNFQIEINQGHVLVYVQYCGYDPDKVRIAVDIVDHVVAKLGDVAKLRDEAEGEDAGEDAADEFISKEVLDNINVEYQKFVVQREGLVTSVKDFQKKMTQQIDELQLPSLDKYLAPKFAAVRSAASRALTCEFCNAYCATSKQALSAHKRGCKSKLGIAAGAGASVAK